MGLSAGYRPPYGPLTGVGFCVERRAGPPPGLFPAKEGGSAATGGDEWPWIPAFAGMTDAWERLIAPLQGMTDAWTRLIAPLQETYPGQGCSQG